VSDLGNELKKELGQVWETVQKELKTHGVDVDFSAAAEECCDSDGSPRPRVKVVCVTPDLKQSVDDMGKALRDQVVMVRVDEDTSRSLDQWVETGAVKSRSEAAALFIQEGMKLRRAELDQLREALDDVESAKEKLRDRAREVFGQD
jgi:hypothetical protein